MGGGDMHIPTAKVRCQSIISTVYGNLKRGKVCRFGKSAVKVNFPPPIEYIEIDFFSSIADLTNVTSVTGGTFGFSL